MLQAILSFFGIIPNITATINAVTAAISNEKIAAITATTQEAQIASNERIVALQAQRDVLIQDASKSNLDLYERTLMATPIGLILWKLFVWDDMLGWGTTDIPSNSPQWTVIMIVIGFYFLHSVGSMFKK